jgi:hypothetical protein
MPPAPAPPSPDRPNDTGGSPGSGGVPGSGGATGGTGGASGTGGGGGSQTGGQAGGTSDTVPDAAPAELPAEVGAEAPADTPAAPYARGVSFSLIEAAQGVFVPLLRGNTEVPAGDRKLELIEGRPLFVRASVTTAAGFAARPVRGVLTVETGLRTEVLTDEKPIAGASKPAELTTSFNFLLPAALVTPATRISLSLYEVGAAATPEPSTPPRYPASGTAPLGIKAGKMELDLVIATAVGPDGTLADTPERRKRVELYLFDVYPVQKLNVRWRPLVKLPKKIAYADGFSLLQSLRTMDGAKPHEYYHLLVPVEDTSETLLGIANVASTTPADGARRIAMTFVRKRAIDSELDTISHEMGHNHGRQHVAGCNAQGIDAKYPYPNTMVGVSGYSLSEAALKPAPMYKDLMGYCYPTWLSDYTFDGFAKRVRAVSAFASTAGTSPRASRSLQGFVEGDVVRWGLVDGAVLAEGIVPTATQFALIHAGGTPVRAAVSYRALGEGQRVHEIAVDLPDDLRDSPERIDVTVGGRSYTLDPRALEQP